MNKNQALTQSKRKDKIRNKTLVSIEVAKNPLSSQRSIAKAIGVSKTTIHNHLKEIDQKGPIFEILQTMVARDLKLVQLGQELIYSKMTDTEYTKTLRISEIALVMRECTARYALFGDKSKHFEPLSIQEDLSQLSTNELSALIKSYL